MPGFAYTAHDADGHRQQGLLDAASKSAVAAQLRQRGWLVLEVRTQQASTEAPPAPRGTIAWGRPRAMELELSLEQLAVMLRGGLTLLAALNMVARQSQRETAARLWRQVSDDIQQGASLADGLAARRLFPELVVQLVRVGELTGTLEAVLSQSARAMENRRRMRGQILTALAYPAAVLVAALAVTAYMVLGVIPKLQVLLSALGRKLPSITQLLLDISTWAQVWWPHVLATAVFAMLGSVGVYRWPPGRLFIDRWGLAAPLLGRVFRLAGTVAFSRSLGTLITSGVTLVEALTTTRDVLANRHLAQVVEQARRAVLCGSGLAPALADPTGFEPLLAGMVAVGESAGTLDEVLEEVTRFHEQQLQAAIRRLSAWIEPAITVVVGGIVGFVYISFFVALFAAGG